MKKNTMVDGIFHKKERAVPLREQEAGECGQQVLDDGPAEALRLLAHLYLLHRKPDKAVILLQALRELRAPDSEVLRALCRALILSGRHAEALKISDALHGAATEPHSSVSALETVCEARLRAEALWGLGQTDEARRTLEAALAETRRSDVDVPGAE